MWARVFEIALACWIALSPFIFRYDGVAAGRWIHDFVIATLIMTFSCLSFHRSFRRAYWVNIAIGLWLVGIGYFGFESPPPAMGQNLFTVGLLLLMFAIIPTDASDPPPKWVEVVEREAEAKGLG
ncbi:MAG: hypothetical protein ACF8PN_10480 [Phycisphaerales bacterium]